MTKDDRHEHKRKRLQDTWDNTPAANPRYGGLTILEATRQFLKGGKREAPKAKPVAQAETSFSLNI